VCGRLCPMPLVDPLHRYNSQFVVSAIEAGYKIGEVPVPVRYMPEASSITLGRSVTLDSGLWPPWRPSCSGGSAWPTHPIFGQRRGICQASD